MGKTFLVLLVLLQAASGQQPNLVGRWRSVETSKGGIGAVYQFYADGALDFSPGAIRGPASYELGCWLMPDGASQGVLRPFRSRGAIRPTREVTEC